MSEFSPFSAETSDMELAVTKSEIKGRSRFCARPAHKAPQCGAFHEFKTAVGFSLLRTVPQSVLRKVPVCRAFTAFLTAPAERK